MNFCVRKFCSSFSYAGAASRQFNTATVKLARPSLEEVNEAGLTLNFVNRNPRNLEFMGIARKRRGWKFQYPRKDYYHKLIFERTGQHSAARIEHWTGKTIISASTKEWAITKQLYSTVDLAAAENIGRIIARRSLQAGITHVAFLEEDHLFKTPKMQAFWTAVKAGGLALSEPKLTNAEYQFGTDYDIPAATTPKR